LYSELRVSSLEKNECNRENANYIATFCGGSPAAVGVVVGTQIHFPVNLVERKAIPKQNFVVAKANTLLR